MNKEHTLSSYFGKLREDFPMLKKTMHGKPLIYFDSAATAQKPKLVIDAICSFYLDHYATVNRAVYELASASTAAYNHVREQAKDFINASKVEEIIFTRGTTESINLVAHCFGKAFIDEGDEILISEIEHHANIVPWQMVCQDRKAILRIIPVNDAGELDMAAYASLLSPKTKIVAISHISNSIGTLHPIKQIIKMAHDNRSYILIDGAQSTPHMPIDVQDLDADFFVFSGHKIYGPTGIGILYGKEKLLSAMPPYQGGGDMIHTVTFPKTTYNTLPLKFEAGTPMIAEVIGLGAALDYLKKADIKKIQEWEHELLEYATNVLMEVDGIHILGTAKEKGAIISFIVDGIHPLDIGTLLDLQGIAIRTGNHCAQPAMHRFNTTSTARLSLAFYNNKDEIDFFSKALQDTLKKLR